MPSTWQLEVLKSVLSLLPLLATWFVGQRILASWDRRKKRQELDIAAAERFQYLYGELKEVARLWRSAKRPKSNVRIPSGLHWDLLARATAAESKYEALVVKLAIERQLTKPQIETLGLFRQAVQTVRSSIREDKVVPSSGFGAEYIAFNELAADVAFLLGADTTPARLTADSAKDNLRDIANVRSADWESWLGGRWGGVRPPTVANTPEPPFDFGISKEPGEPARTS